MSLIEKAPIISIFLPDLRFGGAERVVVNLANGFLERGYSVEMVLMSATGEFLSDLRPGIRVVDLQVKRMRWLLPALLRYLRQARPTAVLACMWPLTVLTLIARLLVRVPMRIVVAEHTTWSRDEITSGPWGRFKVSTTMHYAFPYAEGIVTVSNGAGNDLARFANIDRDEITVIYNPVVGDTLQITCDSLVAAEWWTGSACKVLAAGTLAPIKDYATLLSAFALLRNSIDSKLLILGEGKCRRKLEEQAKQLGIEDNVFIPGFVKDLNPYYKHADLFVLSSKGEGFGNVIVEALNNGTPVVSTDCPSGPREILCGGKFGDLVPVGDVAALAAAMRKALSKPHNHLALKARAKDFSIELAVDKYLQLLLPEIHILTKVNNNFNEN
jgi:glycosyltransferase involved in cell wall biosynthesis